MKNGREILKNSSGKGNRNMKNTNMGIFSTTASWVCTALQTNESFQNLMLILSVISTAFTLIFTALKLANVIHTWYNKAKADGKITSEEIDELREDVSEVLKENEKEKIE